MKRGLFLLPLVLLTACPKSTETTTTVDAAPSASVVASATAAGSAKPAAKKVDKPAPPKISASDREAALKALKDGRHLTVAGQYSAALAEYDKALGIDANDPTVLSEAGYAALLGNELDRSEKYSKRGLESAKDPKLRAMTLYNLGRVYEARGDKDKARAAYSESIGLRDNAEVKKHLDAVGGTTASTIEDKLPCSTPMANVAEVCKCLLADKGEYLSQTGTKWDDSKPSCAEEHPSPPMPAPFLAIVWDPGQPSEIAHLVAVQRADGKTQVLGDMGHDYEPGAFGVHNSFEWKTPETKTEGGRTYVILRGEQGDNDFNMGGLELCSSTEKLEMVCGTGAAPKCTPPIPISVTSGCDVGVQPDENDLKDPETKRTIAEIKKNAHTTHAQTSWALGADGRIMVKLLPGSAPDLIDRSILGAHPIF